MEINPGRLSVRDRLLNIKDNLTTVPSKIHLSPKRAVGYALAAACLGVAVLALGCGNPIKAESPTVSEKDPFAELTPRVERLSLGGKYDAITKSLKGDLTYQALISVDSSRLMVLHQTKEELLASGAAVPAGIEFRDSEDKEISVWYSEEGNVKGPYYSIYNYIGTICAPDSDIRYKAFLQLADKFILRETVDKDNLRDLTGGSTPDCGYFIFNKAEQTEILVK